MLVSVEAVPELNEIKSTDGEWYIGAAVTLTKIGEKLAEEFPALGDMLRVFGSRQIRNRATMGGNLVTASPIGDSAPVLLALDAKVVLSGTGILPVQPAGVSPEFAWATGETPVARTGGTPVPLCERAL